MTKSLDDSNVWIGPINRKRSRKTEVSFNSYNRSHLFKKASIVVINLNLN